MTDTRTVAEKMREISVRVTLNRFNAAYASILTTIQDAAEEGHRSCEIHFQGAAPDYREAITGRLREDGFVWDDLSHRHGLIVSW